MSTQGIANDPGVLEPLAADSAGFGRLLGIGLNPAVLLIDTGQVETATPGKRRVVIVASLKALLDPQLIDAGQHTGKLTPPRPMRRRAALRRVSEVASRRGRPAARMT